MANRDGIQTLFSDAIVDTPNQRGSHGSTFNGVDIPDGQKGSAGEVDEVTLVQVEGGAEGAVKDPLAGIKGS